MAVMRETVRVCDKCKTRDNVEPIRITAYGKSTVVDLCPEHRRPIDDLLTSGRSARRPSMGLATVPNLTEDELAARRRAAARPEKAAKGPRSARQRRPAQPDQGGNSGRQNGTQP